MGTEGQTYPNTLRQSAISPTRKCLSCVTIKTGTGHGLRKLHRKERHLTSLFRLSLSLCLSLSLSIYIYMQVFRPLLSLVYLRHLILYLYIKYWDQLFHQEAHSDDSKSRALFSSRSTALERRLKDAFAPWLTCLLLPDC